MRPDCTDSVFSTNNFAHQLFEEVLTGHATLTVS